MIILTIIIPTTSPLERTRNFLLRPDPFDQLPPLLPFTPVAITANLNSASSSDFGTYEDGGYGFVVGLSCGLAVLGISPAGRQLKGFVVFIYSVETDAVGRGYDAGIIFFGHGTAGGVFGVGDDEVGVFDDFGECGDPLCGLVTGFPVVRLWISSVRECGGRGIYLRSPWFLKLTLELSRFRAWFPFI